ncbi:hypothetical protein ACFZAT_18355 [Streptomyces sp. NPDC008163]|uniref:hypothetical protein n=1 Tax=Streptomyces sp. NPDC008163 TaxID=3364818 RepID=UPI0036EF4B17
MQPETSGSLMPEDQFEGLWLLAEGFESVDIYRDLFSARQAVAVEEAEGKQGELTSPSVVPVAGSSWLRGEGSSPELTRGLDCTGYS